jgi:glutamate synthase domain-containing protein 2
MLMEGGTPDFIIVDGAEGGTGAAPLEFADHIGMPLTEGLITVHNALVGTGPVGVTTQDPKRARALDVADKSERVRRFQRSTVCSAQQIMAAMGVQDPADLRPHMLRRRIGPHEVRSYAELYPWLDSGELLADPPEDWAHDWSAADPDRFTS